MERLAFAALILLAARGSGPEPVATGPRLHAERAASLRDDGSPGREAAFSADGAVAGGDQRLGADGASPPAGSFCGRSPPGGRPGGWRARSGPFGGFELARADDLP
ncbi:MAG: hypothetical protein ACXWUZ_12205 [Allosphingosinicella sp.]